jgi:nitric oxide reductase subunit C
MYYIRIGDIVFTKSTAMKVFLAGTFVLSSAFILLCYDTFREIPKRTNVENMNESVVRGKHLWEDNNCMGCHTLFGEGSYYAPELTKVFSVRGEAYIKFMLKDPQAMWPGRRKMVKYNFTDNEISDLVSFFKWINDVDVNGFPVKTYLQALNEVSTNVEPISLKQSDFKDVDSCGLVSHLIKLK